MTPSRHIGSAGFVICAAYGGCIWENILIHDASSFGKVTDKRKCKFCGIHQERQRFLGAAIRTEGVWVEVPAETPKQDSFQRDPQGNITGSAAQSNSDLPTTRR